LATKDRSSEDAMRTIGFLLLALAGDPALREWVEIADTDQDLSTFYIDPATVERFGVDMR
jgi:hypothetical protein